MIIERLDLRAFGRFTDVSLDLAAGPHRFHLIYGPNESGKSTSLRAITALLFGFPHLAEDNFLHASSKLRVGGVLTDGSGNSLSCIRRRGRKGTLRDGDDNEPIDEAVLQQMMGGIDRDTFRTRFGLSHDDLVRGGAEIVSGEGDLGQILFSAGAGISQLREVQNELDDLASRLYTVRGSKPTINAGLAELDNRRRTLRDAQLAPTEYASFCSRLDAKRSESKQLNEKLQACVVELSQLRSCEQAIPLAPRWRTAVQAVSALSAVPRLDESFSERRRQAFADRELAASGKQELEARMQDLVARLETLPVDATVTQHEAEIQALFQEISAHEKAEFDRSNLVRQSNNNDQKMIKLLRDLSIDIQSADGSESDAIDEAIESIRLSESMRTQIRELASQHDKLVAQRNEASDAVETTKRRLSDTSQEIESLGTPRDPSVLATAIDSVGNPQTLFETLCQRRDACGSLRRRCENLVARLEGFDGSPREAIELHLPSPSALQHLTESLGNAERQLQSIEQRRTRLVEECEQIQDEINRLDASHTLPTLDELTKSRRQRDQVVDEIRTSLQHGGPDASMVGRLQEGIGLADQLVDTLRLHHEQVHKIASLSSRKSLLRSQVDDAEAAWKVEKEAQQKTEKRWQQIWKASGVSAGSPEAMQRWLADHDQLREFVSTLSEEEKQVEQAEQRIHRAMARLRSALGAPRSKRPVPAGPATQAELFDEAIDQDLIALYDDAVLRRGEWTRERHHYDLLCRRRDELADQLPKSETRFEACQTSLEQWRDDWRRSTASFLRSQQATPRETLQMLDQILQLQQMKKEREILVRRIESIDRDKQQFASRVDRLAANTNEACDDRDTADAVAQRIYQRLQTERTAARSRDTLKDQIETTQQRLSDANAQIAACDAVLSQLCQEAGCDSESELPDLEHQSRQRVVQETTLRDLENQLGLLAGDQPLDQFIERATTLQPSLLELEVEQKSRQLEQLREQIAAVEQEIGAIQHVLDRMDGGAKASEVVQSIQCLAGQISRDAEQFVRYRVASLILRRAIEHYRNENQSPVLAEAEKYFAQLTCGEYTRLKVDYDAKGKSTLFAVRSDRSGDVPVHAMSTGTADALYLALRLGSLQHQVARGESIPLIVDDCLVQLDDARASATLQSFSNLSLSTQVILFTHHGHVVDLAQRVLKTGEFHVHELKTTA